MLKLRLVAQHEWEFVYPELYRSLMGDFHMGCELYEEDKLDQAERVFRAVLGQMPDHLDAIHHLATVLSQRNQASQARDLWDQAVRIGRKAFPQDFELGRDRLEWGWLENRPFLRCLHGLALAKYNEGKTEDALQLCEELLSLNPNDNQGVRAIAEEVLFKLGRFEDALKIAEQYPADVMPEILYGRALALFKLGRREEASKALRKAVKYLPLVAKELLKQRHHLPSTARKGLLTSGGDDEAYYYWEHWGRFWEEDVEALDNLRRIAGPDSRSHQREG
jgi:tetratricopeptide (TPR) repeat protein